MPEGSELRLSADHLQRLLTDKQLERVQTLPSGRYADVLPKGLKEFNDELDSYSFTVKKVDVHGKFMWWELTGESLIDSYHEDETWYVFITYGMSGQWNEFKTKWSAVQVDFADRASVFFNDVRHFGTLSFHQGHAVLAKKLTTLGIDLLKQELNEETTKTLLKKARQKDHKSLAEILMDQRVFAGVGNYVKCEALYASRLDPRTIVKNVGDDRLKRLFECVADVMRRSYEKQGASFSTYVNPDGSEGKSTLDFAVYGKKTDPFGNPVTRERTRDKRTSWFVKEIQR